MNLRDAMCRIAFKFKHTAIQSLLEQAKLSRGSMSNWLYLIGSFCFVAGTLINMVQR
jgi:hypothetical protein